MKKIITAAAIAGAGVAAALVGSAAPAQATTFDCAPCVSIPGVPNWEQVTGNGPWETIFPSEGSAPWDNAFSKGTWENGVKAVTGGSWEKAFPPAN